MEDNDDNWAVMHLHLGDKFDLVRAATDQDACDILRREGSQLSGVLMDIELQGSALDGVELTRILRGRSTRDWIPEYARDVGNLNIPIIFVTAYEQVYSFDELIQAGGDDVMAKPVDFPALNMMLMKLQVSRMSTTRRDAGT